MIKTILRLKKYLEKNIYRLLLAFFLILAGNLSMLFVPRLIAGAIDMFGTTEDFSITSFSKLLVLIGALYLVGNLFSWLASRISYRIAFRTVRNLSTDVFKKLGKLPLSFFDKCSHGDIINTLTNDAETVSDGLSQMIFQLISGTLSILISLIMMLILDIRVAMVAIFVTPLCFFTGWTLSIYGKKKFRDQAKHLGRLNGFAEEYIRSEEHTLNSSH